MQKDQRLLDLAALLLKAAEPVSWREIQEQFADDYAGKGEAAIRKFERDKADLLELGHPGPLGRRRRGPPGRLPHRQGRVLPPRPEAPAGGPRPPVPGRLGRARERDLPVRARPRPRAQQALLRGARPGRLRGGGARGAPALVRGRRPGRRRRGRLEELSRAVAQKKRVHLVYLGAERRERTERDVDPYGLFQQGGAWYLVGWCHCASAIRTFHVARIESLGVNAVDAAHRPTSSRARTSRSRTTRPARPGSTPTTPPVRCRVRLDPPLSAEVLASFGPRARVEEEGGGAVVEVDATNSEGLLRHVLGLGDRAEVLAPKDLRSAPARSPRSRRGSRRRGETPARGPRPPPRRRPPARLARAEGAAPTAGRAVARRTKAPGAGPPRKADPRDRLRRVLFLVPYAVRHPGIPVRDLARRCGCTERELLEDLDFLLGVGSPPFAPDDFLDLYVEGDRVYVALHQSFSRPPRFTESEARRARRRGARARRRGAGAGGEGAARLGAARPARELRRARRADLRRRAAGARLGARPAPARHRRAPRGPARSPLRLARRGDGARRPPVDARAAVRPLVPVRPRSRAARRPLAFRLDRVRECTVTDAALRPARRGGPRPRAPLLRPAGRAGPDPRRRRPPPRWARVAPGAAAREADRARRRGRRGAGGERGVDDAPRALARRRRRGDRPRRRGATSPRRSGAPWARYS